MAGLKTKANETFIVERRLRESQPGEIITYEEISKLLGQDVRKCCIGCVATARRALQEESIFFDTVPKVGYRRLNNEEACKAAAHYVTKSRRAAKRGIKHLQNVPYTSLSPESQKSHLTLSTQLGVIELFGSGKAHKRIAETASAGTPIPIGETLKLFSSP